MSTFWIVGAIFAAVALLFVAVALLFVIPPLLLPQGGTRHSRGATNLAIYRDQARELDADLAAGTLSAEQHEKARRELEARLLEEIGDDRASVTAPARSRAVALATGVALPSVALALYFMVGNPQAMSPQSAAAAEAAAHGLQNPQLEGMVEKLAARLRQNPEQPEGWAMLGRSYGALGRFGDAAQAYANAAARRPNDAGLLADYADALAMAQGRRLQGEPETIIANALKADPANLKALALAGSAAFEKQDYAAAIGYWERILPGLPPESEGARSIQTGIAEARSLGGADRGSNGMKAR